MNTELDQAIETVKRIAREKAIMLVGMFLADRNIEEAISDIIYSSENDLTPTPPPMAVYLNVDDSMFTVAISNSDMQDKRVAFVKEHGEPEADELFMPLIKGVYAVADTIGLDPLGNDGNVWVNLNYDPDNIGEYCYAFLDHEGDVKTMDADVLLDKVTLLVTYAILMENSLTKFLNQ